MTDIETVSELSETVIEQDVDVVSVSETVVIDNEQESHQYSPCLAAVVDAGPPSSVEKPPDVDVINDKANSCESMLVDSGATAHISNTEDDFSSYNESFQTRISCYRTS